MLRSSTGSVGIAGQYELDSGNGGQHDIAVTDIPKSPLSVTSKTTLAQSGRFG